MRRARPAPSLCARWPRFGALRLLAAPSALLLGAGLALSGCEPVKSPLPSTSGAPPEGAAPEALTDDGALGGLFPSRSERQTNLARALGRQLELTLLTDPALRGARVQLTLPAPPSPLGEPSAETATAFVVLQHGAQAPSWRVEEVRALVAGAVSGLAPERVTVRLQKVEEVPAAAAAKVPEWVALGPLRVERTSAPLLRWILGALSAGSLLLVGVVGVLWWRLRFGWATEESRPTPRSGLD